MIKQILKNNFIGIILFIVLGISFLIYSINAENTIKNLQNDRITELKKANEIHEHKADSLIDLVNRRDSIIKYQKIRIKSLKIVVSDKLNKIEELESKTNDKIRHIDGASSSELYKLFSEFDSR